MKGRDNFKTNDFEHAPIERMVFVLLSWYPRIGEEHMVVFEEPHEANSLLEHDRSFQEQRQSGRRHCE